MYLKVNYFYMKLGYSLCKIHEKLDMLITTTIPVSWFDIRISGCNVPHFVLNGGSLGQSIYSGKLIQRKEYLTHFVLNRVRWTKFCCCNNST